MMKLLIKLIRAQNIGEYGLTPAKCAADGIPRAHPLVMSQFEFLLPTQSWQVRG